MSHGELTNIGLQLVPINVNLPIPIQFVKDDKTGEEICKAQFEPIIIDEEARYLLNKKLAYLIQSPLHQNQLKCHDLVTARFELTYEH